MTLKPGDTFTSMRILRVASDRAEVFYSCCERTATPRIETIHRHIASGRSTCAKCAADAKMKGKKQEPKKEYSTTGTVITGMMKAGKHNWWPLSGGMGR